MRQIPKLLPSNSLLVLCDIQEVFKPRIFNMSQVLNSSQFLIRSFSHMKVPLLVSQHYSKVFGETCSELQTAIKETYKDNYCKIEKRQFSLLTEDFTKIIEKKPEVKNIILFGIETHICILNSAEDFLRNNLEVYVIADATSSQREYDRKIALKRLGKSGVNFSTAESIVYEMLHTSEASEFKEVLKEVKNRNTDGMFK